MVKSITWREGLLDLVFLNQDFVNFGDAGGLRGSVSAGYVYIAGHTADPYLADQQDYAEVSYTGYARIQVPRDSANWSRTGNLMRNKVALAFPLNTGATEPTITHLSIGGQPTGPGVPMYPNVITPVKVRVSPFQVQFAIGEIVIGEL